MIYKRFVQIHFLVSVKFEQISNEKQKKSNQRFYDNDCCVSSPDWCVDD